MIELPIFNSNDRYKINPTKVIALGLNYRDHIAESHSVQASGFDPAEPEEPILFPKTPNCLIGPGENIVIPKFLDEYDFDDCRVEHEAELAFIIGETCKNVSEDDALRVIYGYLCLNDVSQRNIQLGDQSGWFRGKSLDTFGPIGPQLVLSKDIGDPQNLDIECRLNGKTVQKSNTKQMIFSIPTMVAFVSKNFTLFQGDIISTGTPSGVGRIKHGDVVEVEIEKIGTLKNPVVEESQT